MVMAKARDSQSQVDGDGDGHSHGKCRRSFIRKYNPQNLVKNLAFLKKKETVKCSKIDSLIGAND